MGINYTELKDILEKKANMAIGHLEQLKCFVPEFKEVLDSILYISETLNNLKFLDTECPHCKGQKEEPQQNKMPGQDFIGKPFEYPGRRLVLFYSEGCEPCQKIKPLIEQIVVEQEIVYQPVCVDTDEGRMTAERYGVQGWPTFFVVEGGIIREINSGYEMNGTEESNKERIRNTIKRGLGL